MSKEIENLNSQLLSEKNTCKELKGQVYQLQQELVFIQQKTEEMSKKEEAFKTLEEELTNQINDYKKQIDNLINQMQDSTQQLKSKETEVDDLENSKVSRLQQKDIICLATIRLCTVFQVILVRHVICLLLIFVS